MNSPTVSGHRQLLGRTATEWLLSLPIFLLLVLTLVVGTGEFFHSQLLRMGESLFGDPSTGVQYFALREDPVKPACDPNIDIDAAVAREIAAQQVGTDPLDEMFAEPVNPDAIRSSITNAVALCREKYAAYQLSTEHVTPVVRVYRAFETSFYDLFHFGIDNRPLILLLMVLLASINTTLGEHHIALRPPQDTPGFPPLLGDDDRRQRAAHLLLHTPPHHPGKFRRAGRACGTQLPLDRHVRHPHRHQRPPDPVHAGTRRG